MLNPQLSQHIDDFYSIEGAAGKHKNEEDEEDSRNGRSNSWWTGVNLFRSVAGSLLVILGAAIVHCSLAPIVVVQHQQSLLCLAVGLVVGAALGGVPSWWTNSSTGMNVTLRGLLQKKIYNKRMIRECKEWNEQISTLLGSVGAPLLNHSMECSNCSFSKNQLDLLLEFVRSQVALLLKIHETINLIRRGTSLLFGVDSRNVSIERIEKAALGRWSNHVEEGSLRVIAGRMPVSFPTLRKRVNEILQQQIESLLAISGENSTHEYLQRESDMIITLALLASKKTQAVELLASIVERSCSIADEDTFTAMELCMNQAERSCSYISAAAQSTFPWSNSDSDQSSREQSIVHLLDQVESLRIALLAYRDNNTFVDQQQGVLTGTSSRSSDWHKFEKLAHSFGEAVEHTTKQIMQRVNSWDASQANSESGDESDTLIAGQQEGDASYTAAMEQNPGVETNAPDDSKSQQLKTLVFSGVAAQRMRRPRKRPTKISVNSDNNASLPPHFQLVDELNERLRTLPPADELNVHLELDHDNDDNILDSTAAAARHNLEGNCDFVKINPTTGYESGGVVSKMYTSAFLGELKGSVANSINKEDQCLQWDNTWERDPS